MTVTKPLAGRVALVTGGSRGIGAAIVRGLAADGADVAFSYAASAEAAGRLVAEVEGMGVRALAVKAGRAARLVTMTHGRFGRLDILVNSAGLSIMGGIADPAADPPALERQFAINVTAVAAMVRTAAPLLNDGGRIITIGSVFGERMPFAGWGDYAASKAAVGGYTRAWARDLGPRGITVNLVQPGPIDTDGNPASGGHAPAAMTALGRYGHPSEVVAVVAFLAGPGAGYVTGATLTVDGGMLA